MREIDRWYMEQRKAGKTHAEILGQFRAEEQAHFDEQIQEIEKILDASLRQLHDKSEQWVDKLKAVPINPQLSEAVKEVAEQLNWLAGESRRTRDEIAAAEVEFVRLAALQQTSLMEIGRLQAQIAQNSAPPEWIPPGGGLHLGNRH